jgi:REP element-mobilizing transposase RayT
MIVEELGRLLAPPNPPVWAAAIEPNHVHLLLGRVEEDISRLTGRLKGRTSSVVGALAMNEDRQRVWTSGFWKVFLFDDLAVQAVKSYIEAHNRRRNLPAAPFPWITPYDEPIQIAAD